MYSINFIYLSVSLVKTQSSQDEGPSLPSSVMYLCCAEPYLLAKWVIMWMLGTVGDAEKFQMGFDLFRNLLSNKTVKPQVYENII